MRRQLSVIEVMKHRQRLVSKYFMQHGFNHYRKLSSTSTSGCRTIAPRTKAPGHIFFCYSSSNTLLKTEILKSDEIWFAYNHQWSILTKIIFSPCSWYWRGRGDGDVITKLTVWKINFKVDRVLNESKRVKNKRKQSV